VKSLRVFLQIAILLAGGIALAALISQPELDFTSIFGFLGFVAFLLALTLALKDETEGGMLPSHKRSFRHMGLVLMLLGAFGIVYGVSFVIGSQSIPNGSGTCRAVCGLILLASQLFGDGIAKVFAFGLWSSVGLFLCFIGLKLKAANGT
jgi:hypothetical protein